MLVLIKISRSTYQDVFVLDVPVDDAPLMGGQDGLHHLDEEALGQLLVQPPALGDKVKEVLAAGRALQDEDVRVRPFIEVQQPDHAGDGGHLAKQAYLQGHPHALELQRKKNVEKIMSGKFEEKQETAESSLPPPPLVYTYTVQCTRE